MKFLAFATLLVLNIVPIIAQKTNKSGEFALSGKIIGQETGYVHLYYINIKEERIHDSCLLQNGSFLFKGLISEPSRGFFHGNRKSQRASDPNAVDIYLEPKPIKAVFEINKFKEGKITGSFTHTEYIALEKEHIELDSTKWKKFWNDFNEINATKGPAEAYIFRDKSIDLIRADANAIDYHFMQNHPGSYISIITLINESHLPTDSIKMFYNRFSPQIQQSRYGKILAEKIRAAEATTIGNSAPLFTQNDANGKAVSLSDFKGKYVLLEFWASWCKPCREQNPVLIKLYHQYKDKGFIILGISKDNKKEDWLNAIKKDKITWPQLSDLKGNENAIALKYNVQPIPDNFLIDPSGKIIATYLSGNALEEKLKALLK